MKRLLMILSTICVCLILTAPFHPVSSEVRWNVLGTINLEDRPKDLTLSRDGTTAYILTEHSILLVSLPENKITEKIPLTESFERIALSADESTIYLTPSQSQHIVLMQISQKYQIETGKSPIIGNPKAPVSIVAFFDFQCPYCARTYPTLKQLLEKYPKDVNLIIKHYPLPMHRFAEHAARAALAAEKQKKYQEFTETLFVNFSNINEQTIQKYAQDAGFDMKKFNNDIADPSIADIINADRQLAHKLKVRGVPALFVNGVVAKGRSLEALSQMIEQALQNN